MEKTTFVNSENIFGYEKNETIRIYCDESCHLKNDKTDVITIGAIIINENCIKKFKRDFNKILSEHSYNFKEVKWTTLGPKYLQMYKSIINLFFSSNCKFFSISIYNFDKNKYNNKKFDDFYYAIYEILLDKLIQSPYSYKIIIDKKDTVGYQKIQKLYNVLTKEKFDFNHKMIKYITEEVSDYHSCIQVCDIIIGALTYYLRAKFGDLKESKLNSLRIDLYNFIINTWRDFISSNEVVNNDNELSKFVATAFDYNDFKHKKGAKNEK